MSAAPVAFLAADVHAPRIGRKTSSDTPLYDPQFNHNLIDRLSSTVPCDDRGERYLADLLRASSRSGTLYMSQDNFAQCGIPLRCRVHIS